MESLGREEWGIRMGVAGRGGVNVGDCRNYFSVTIILMVIPQWDGRSENAVFLYRG
jgi:hypothetical protein